MDAYVGVCLGGCNSFGHESSENDSSRKIMNESLLLLVTNIYKHRPTTEKLRCVGFLLQDF